jgi:hypothetical protein
MAAMRMLLVVVSLVCCLASSAEAEEWTASDTAFESAFVALLAADYLQTRQITACGRDPECGQRESNPIMGHGGERVPPAVYFATIGLAHVAAVRLTPKKYRPVLHLLSIGVQTMAVAKNWTAGYAVEF